MKIYISGPITGTSDYMERFNNAQKRIESRGHSVINPALVNANLPNDTTYDEYMSMSFTMLDMCDAIYLLNGFEKSKGALMEIDIARKKDLLVLTESVSDEYIDICADELLESDPCEPEVDK